jgi:hypothetical protein
VALALVVACAVGFYVGQRRGDPAPAPSPAAAAPPRTIDGPLHVVHTTSGPDEDRLRALVGEAVRAELARRPPPPEERDVPPERRELEERSAERARRMIDDAKRARRWTAADAQGLDALLPNMDPAARLEVLRSLAVAVNRDEVKADGWVM